MDQIRLINILSTMILILISNRNLMLKEKEIQRLTETVHLMINSTRVQKKTILNQIENYKYSQVPDKLMAVMSNT